MLTLKQVLYGLSAAAILLVGGSFLLPSQATVARSITIDAPTDRVFAIVGDLRRLHEFWPKADIDPAIRYAYEGTDSGLGQKLVWRSSHPEVGDGVIVVTGYNTPEAVEFRTASGRERFASGFNLTPAAAGTRVTWTYTANLHGIPARWSGLLEDGRIGPEFEQGLKKLKAVAEKP